MRASSHKAHRGGTLSLYRYGVHSGLKALARSARRHLRNDGPASPAADSDAHPRPFVHETRSCKSLHFCVRQTQSRMLKRDPDALVVDYTRTMMGFLLLNAQPRRIGMIGLGGGSLAKFCYRILPQTRIDVVEINPHVVALRDEFCVPPDDERFRVHLDDGAAFVGQLRAAFDVLLIDAYTRTGLPTHLSTPKFFASCRRALRDDGVLAANLYCPDSDAVMDRLRDAFRGEVFCVDEEDGTNRVAFACTGQQLRARPRMALRAPDPIPQASWDGLLPEFARVRWAIRRSFASELSCMKHENGE